MLQGPIGNTIWARCLSHFETPYFVLHSLGLVSLGSLAGAMEYIRIASLTSSMSAATDGSFAGWIWAFKLPARTLAFSESERASPSGVTREGVGVGILITPLVIFHSDWSCGSRLSSVLLQWYFLHFLSWLVTDLCRRLNSAFNTGSLVICHRLLNRHSGVFHPEYEPALGAVSHHVGDTWERSLPTFSRQHLTVPWHSRR